MTRWDKAFIVFYALVIFPQELIYLHTAPEMTRALLMYMGGLLGVHIGMLVYSGRNDDDGAPGSPPQ